ncbi:MAG: Uncharacterised protein [Synechococcus sp. CC9902]|nr:MAG: Uncharacterised protein [Synechococcus sp. CC9902]
MPGPQFILVEGIVEAEQADSVFDAAEARSRPATHALGGTVGAEKRWI